MRHVPQVLLEAAERCGWEWLLLARHRRRSCSGGVHLAHAPIQAGLDHGTCVIPRP